MASRSLGTLTLDLVAKTGGYVSGLSKSERETEKWKRKVKNQVDDVSKSFKVLSVAAIAGVGLLTRKIIQESSAQESAIAQLRQGLESTGGVVGRSLDELSREASRLQSISIFGDDQILEAQSQLVTFTNIVGDQFDRTTQAALDLSTRMGQDLRSSVLQLGKALNDPIANLGALGRAGIQFSDSQKETIKNLAETNRIAEAQDIILKELERQFGGSARAARDTLAGSLKALNNAFSDLFEQEKGAYDLSARINDLTDILQDPATIAAAQALAGAIISGFSKAIEIISDTIGVVRFLSEELAANLFGPAIDDIVRLDDHVANLKSTVATLEPLALARPGDRAIADQLKDAQQELEKYSRLLEAAKETAATTPSIAEVPTAPTVPGRGPTVPPGEPPSAAATRFIEQLKTQVALLGKSSIETELYKLQLEGASEEQLNLARSLLGTVDAFEKQEEAQKKAREEIAKINDEALSIQASLRTEEEAIEESYNRRREIILKNTEVTGQAQTELLRRLEEDRKASLENTSANREQRSQLEALERGVEAIADAMRTEEQVIEDSYQRRRDTILAYVAETGVAQTELITKLEEDRQAQLEELEAKRRLITLQNQELLFSGIADLAREFAGEESAIFKAAFAIEKAAAIARAIVAIQTGIAEAAAQPFPANLAAIATVTSATASIVSTIQGTSLGQAHDGLMSVPKTGTYLLERGERVTTEKTSAKLDQTLDEVQKGGGGTVVQIVDQRSGGEAPEVQTSMTPDGQEMIRVMIRDAVSSSISSGQMDRVMAANYGLRRRGS